MVLGLFEALTPEDRQAILAKYAGAAKGGKK
jgi:hypothetical protein